MKGGILASKAGYYVDNYLAAPSDVELVLYEESSLVVCSAALLSSARKCLSSLWVSSSGGEGCLRRFLIHGSLALIMPAF